MATLRELSKQMHGVPDGDTVILDHVNAGSLQRIADATEAMARNYLQLQFDLASYKKWFEESEQRVRDRDRTISALRGQITKLKKGGVN